MAISSAVRRRVLTLYDRGWDRERIAASTGLEPGAISTIKANDKRGAKGRSAASRKANQTRKQEVLRVLTDAGEIKSAYKALALALKTKARKVEAQIGWQHGTRKVTVHWHDRLRFWVALEPKLIPNRYWIGFGLMDPKRHKLLQITCEANPPREGVDRRCAGVFVRDRAGNLMLGHTGKIGGGRVGIGKTAFLRGYSGREIRAEWKNRDHAVRSEVIVIGRIRGSNFLSEVSNFIVEVELFKQGATGNSLETARRLKEVAEAAVKDGRFDPENVVDAREKIMASIVARRGQDGFRKRLLTEYAGRCAVTGCDCAEALEAAHIRPYFGPETNHVTNGLLLRSDVHTLFDLQKVGVDHHLKVFVSTPLRGTAYGALHGRPLSLPKSLRARPNAKALKLHLAGVK